MSRQSSASDRSRRDTIYFNARDHFDDFSVIESNLNSENTPERKRSCSTIARPYPITNIVVSPIRGADCPNDGWISDLKRKYDQQEKITAPLQFELLTRTAKMLREASSRANTTSVLTVAPENLESLASLLDALAIGVEDETFDPDRCNNSNEHPQPSSSGGRTRRRSSLQSVQTTSTTFSLSRLPPYSSTPMNTIIEDPRGSGNRRPDLSEGRVMMSKCEEVEYPFDTDTASVTTETVIENRRSVPMSFESEMEEVVDTSCSDVEVMPDEAGGLSVDIASEDLSSRAQDSVQCAPSPEILRELKLRFGYNNFRPSQLQAVNAARMRRNCFVLMLPGGGKSLCYQLPALLSFGITLVVSKRVGMMGFQQQKLAQMGVKTAVITRITTPAEKEELYSMIRSSTLKILFVMPDTLRGASGMASLSLLSDRISLVVVDEAQSISDMSHSFDPDFRYLCGVQQLLPKVPWMLLSSVSTANAMENAIEKLGIQRCVGFISCLDRQTLHISVRPKRRGKRGYEDLKETLLSAEFDRNFGLIYCASRYEATNLAIRLQNDRFNAISYHSQLRSQQLLAELFTYREQIVCLARGCDVDEDIRRRNVRFVIHWTMPQSLEVYYEQISRAGADGNDATSVLFYNYSDAVEIKRTLMMQKVKPIQMEKWNQMVTYCENIVQCRRKLLKHYFDHEFHEEECEQKKHCDVCSATEIPIKKNVTEEASAIVNAVQRLTAKGFVRIRVRDIVQTFLGSAQATFKNDALFGQGHDWKWSNAERLVRMLVREQYLTETVPMSHLPYIRRNYSRAVDPLDEAEPLVLDIFPEPRREVAVSEDHFSSFASSYNNQNSPLSITLNSSSVSRCSSVVGVRRRKKRPSLVLREYAIKQCHKKAKTKTGLQRDLLSEL